MPQTQDVPVIAYLAPEIPALSATFVYEELLALERRGFRVVPISVRRPASDAKAQAALAIRTLLLYDKPAILMAIRGLLVLAMFQAGAVQALKRLLVDMAELGWTRRDSWKLVYQFLAATRLAGLLQSNGCVHLHVHFAHVPAQIAMYASALSGIPFTITAHANDIFERGLLLRKKAERAVRLLTISDYNRRYLEDLGIPRARMAVVRCGVSFPSISRPAAILDRVRLRVGTLGRLVEKKGVDVLIHAAAEIRQAGLPIELRIAGDGPLKADLEGLVTALGMNDVIQFEGSMSHHKVAAWMHNLDVFVLACRVDKRGDMDGVPVVLMEAMSQLVPVVSTRLSGIPELVIHGETGLLAAPDDSHDLAQQIIKVFQNPELRSALIAKAQKHVVNEFGQDTNIQRLIECFELP